jgi:transcriptional regulator with XRE-family HTH domain
MAAYERAVERGRRLGRAQRRRLGEELRIARLGAGLSQRALGRVIGRSHSTIGRIERAVVANLSIDLVAVLASVLGLDLRVALFPDGSPVRDVAHLALLERLHRRLGAGLRWRVEVPIPIAGDRRAADGMVDSDTFDAIVEAETRIGDVQALIRRIDLKQRDMGARRVILLLADTRHNRAVLANVPELKRRFPVSTRGALAALSRGLDPGGDAIVLL